MSEESKLRLLSFFTLLSSFFVYMEWGTDSHSFIFQSEYEFLRILLSDTANALHPFTLIPFVGQICLLIAGMKRSPSRALLYTGIFSLGLLLLFVLFIGILKMNFPMILSVLPFLTGSTLMIVQMRKRKKAQD